LKQRQHGTWIEDLRCRRDSERYALAYNLIPVTVVQSDLHIVRDEVLEFKVELPRKGRGEEDGKNESTTQEGNPKHDGAVKEVHTARDEALQLYLWRV
jgi:hypothetical protein